jgi:L-lactate dehydrogenase (cytochrome)
MGSIDPQSLTGTPVVELQKRNKHVNVPSTKLSKSSKPDLFSLISVHDFEDIARETFTAKAYAFYSSAATDLVSHHANLHCHRKLLLRPRVLRNVRDVTSRRRILGCQSSVPFFVSPAAMARLAHPDGELALARGCGNRGMIQTVSDLPGTSWWYKLTVSDFK